MEICIPVSLTSQEFTPQNNADKLLRQLGTVQVLYMTSPKKFTLQLRRLEGKGDARGNQSDVAWCSQPHAWQ